MIDEKILISTKESIDSLRNYEGKTINWWFKRLTVQPTLLKRCYCSYQLKHAKMDETQISFQTFMGLQYVREYRTRRIAGCFCIHEQLTRFRAINSYLVQWSMILSFHIGNDWWDGKTTPLKKELWMILVKEISLQDQADYTRQGELFWYHCNHWPRWTADEILTSLQNLGWQR